MKRGTTATDALRFYWNIFKRFRFLGMGAITAISLATVAESLAPFVFKALFDLLESTDQLTASIELFIPIILALPAVKFTAWLMWRVQDSFAIPFQTRAMAYIESTAYGDILKHSTRFFADNFAGSLVKKVGRASRGFELLADQVQFTFVPAIFMTIAACIGLGTRFPLLSLVFFAWIVFFVVFQLIASQWAVRVDTIRAELDSKAGGILADGFTNSQTIKTHASEAYEYQIFKTAVEEYARIQRKSWWIHTVILATQAFLMIAIQTLLIYMGVKAWVSGALSLGDIALIQTYLVIVIDKLWDIGRALRHTFDSIVDAKELVEVLNNPVEIKDKRGAKDLAVTQGAIELQNVTFGFAKGKNVLRDFNLDIQANEKIALVGPSGAGKTTLTKLLFRFYDTKRGKILIDGQDIAQVTQRSLRENISLVPQDPILFHRSIKDNIRYGNLEATDEAIIDAAKRAHCHEFITQLKDGYDTFVGERGVKLSGGERQRVAIARAILRNAPILVLDEATSALDSASEHLIQDALEELMKEKTVIVIAHRLSTIMMMDRIVVVEQGRISDLGTHEELIKNRGTYNDLWELQAGAFNG